MTRPVFRFFVRMAIAASLSVLLPFLGLLLCSKAQAQPAEPLDYLDETNDDSEKVINCVATATPTHVPWGHRFTYWLSGIARFDDSGNMMPIAPNQTENWLLTVTNSRFAAAASYKLTVLASGARQFDFAFPAVSLPEWELMGEQPSDSYVTALSYAESTHGLYLAIRNTQSSEPSRQLFQVVHYLGENFPIVSEVSACFVGPRPMTPTDVATPSDRGGPQL